MDTRLLEVHPNELKFIVEVEKHSSCSIQLTNNTFDHVAFKVKTTNVKKFCVRPNMGVIKPFSTCEVSFTMQAQKTPPPDMTCKDKFLIQSTIVSVDTTVEDIASSTLFGKNGSKDIEEMKLATILVSPSSSPITVEALRKGMTVRDSDQSNEKQMEELKLKITELELNLHKVQVSISKLEEERTSSQKTKSSQKNCLISCSIL